MHDKNLLKDFASARCTPRPNRPELAEVAFHSGTPDGFSMEWALDRFSSVHTQDGRSN